MISNILVFNPLKRLTIKEILSHNWLKKFDANFDYLHYNNLNNNGLNLQKHIIPFDENVILKVKELESQFETDYFKKQIIRSHIIQNKLNNFTTCYYLISRKDENTENISNYNSKIFENYISSSENLLQAYDYNLEKITMMRCNSKKHLQENISNDDKIKTFNKVNSLLNVDSVKKHEALDLILKPEKDIIKRSSMNLNIANADFNNIKFKLSNNNDMLHPSLPLNKNDNNKRKTIMTTTDINTNKFKTVGLRRETKLIQKEECLCPFCLCEGNENKSEGKKIH